MDTDDQPRWKLALQVLFLIEWAALLIALVMPVTPSKTGKGKVRLAEFFIQDATYLHEVLFGFVFTNLIIGLLASIFWVYMRFDRRRSKQAGS